MSLTDQDGLSQNVAFQSRVKGAVVHAALAVAAEVTNEVQTLGTTGTATGGTFTLVWGGQTTAAIPWNASAGQVQLSVSNLGNVGAGNVVCTGGPLPGAGVTITWCGTLGNSPQNLPTVGTNSLTGTGTPAPALTRVTPGTAFPGHAARQVLASKVLQNPQGYAVLMAPGVADNATVVADFNPAVAGYPLAAGKTDAQADSDVQFQVNSIWGAYV